MFSYFRGSASFAPFPPHSRRLVDKEIVGRQSAAIDQHHRVDKKAGQSLGTDGRKAQQKGDDEHEIIRQERP